MKLWQALMGVALAGCLSAPTRGELRTFCNPLDLDYGVMRTKAGIAYRHGADPVVVLFNGKYYLFSTWDLPGYRVSDDLISWRTIPFTAPEEIVGKTYTAAAVTPIGDWLYYTEFGKADRRVAIYRTKEPEGGAWERVAGDLPPYADPCLFVDPPTGRLYMYYGLERPIHGVELDRKTLAEIDGTKIQLMPTFVPGSKIENGWEVCTWDNSEASKGMRGNRSFNPCREGAWMTFYGGKYYLQYASPGTTVPGYADGVLVGDSPLGPFMYSNQSPISQKDSGFITSAGHGCLFQDKHGNWWRAVTMLVGVLDRFERRVGLFPAGFDTDRVPYTRTELGDLPLVMPEGKRDPMGDVRAGWQVLSEGATVTASSELERREGKFAADEDVRTWWSAKTGDKGEWVRVDLGKAKAIHAVQVNLAEEGYGEAAKDDAHRYVVEASADGTEWESLVDARGNAAASAHRYAQLKAPVRARYVRATGESMPGGGKFAVRDLRVFGVGEGPQPATVQGVTAERDTNDRRKVTIRWEPADGATGYLVRYGTSEGKPYHHHQVRGTDARELTIYSLNAEPPYFFRVDAINEAGTTTGTGVAKVE
jgi:hypothetical protein